MNTRHLNLAAKVIIAALLFFPIVSYGSTTTLLSQDFNDGGSTFPPAGWSVNSLFSNGSYSTGWHWSTGGDGNTDGSAVAQTFVGYPYTSYPDPPPYVCYAPNPPYTYSGTLPNGSTTDGSYLGPLTLTSPSVDVSSYPSTDTQFVDFDIFFPKNYWEYNCVQYYGSYLGLTVTVYDGTNAIKTLNAGGGTTAGDETYEDVNNYTDPDDPSEFTSSGDWGHFHIALPSGVSSHQITFKVDMEYPTTTFSCHAWYTPDVAFDNIKITNVHYDLIQVLGPSPVNFGTVLAGNPQTQYVKIKNLSTTRSVNFTNYMIAGADAADFTITSSPSSIAAGATDSIGVSFNPLATGGRVATLKVNSDADNIPLVSVQLLGTGIAPAVQYGTSSLFRGVKVRLGNSLTQYIPIRSTGAGPLTINSIYSIGLNSQNYFVSYFPQNPLPAGQSDSIGITFSPIMEGRPEAAIVINTNASNNPHDTVQMLGTGILPRLVINNAYANVVNINFDSVNVGTTVCQTVTLFNPGTDTVAITRNFVSRSDYDFVLTPLTGSDTLIAPEQSQHFAICFTPLKNGYRTAMITVSTNIPQTFTTPRQDTSQFTILLSGTGVPFGHLTLSTGALADTTIVGTQICTSMNVTNNGTTDVTLTSASFAGASASAFVFSGTTFPVTLAAGATQVFSICGTPAVRGDNLATLTVTGTTNGQTISSTVPVDVVGLSVCASATPSVAFNSSACLGDMPDTATITVTNCGDVATTYTAALSGASAADYQIVAPTVSSSVASNGTATFQIVYKPTNVGTSPATVNITGGTGVTPMSVQLNGSAGAAAIAGGGTAPATEVGMTSASFAVTINNTGTCEWTPGVPTVSGPFTYVSGGTTPIAPGGNTTMMFTFSPTATGIFSGTLSFPTAVGVSVPPAYVTINGTATSSSSVAQKTSQDGFTLGQSYPNPTNGDAIVTFTLPNDAPIRIELTDAKGNVVRTAFTGRMTAGDHSVTLSANDLASGTYFYTLVSGDVRLTRELILLR